MQVFYTYDKLHRLTEMQFQDEKITYGYSPTNLISSSRYKKDNLIYSFNQEINWNGKAISQSLPNDFSISYEWDDLNRCTSIKSNPFNQSFIYNAFSNITSTTITDSEGSYDTHFSYDDLNQITEEKGHFNNTYIFDSLNNRRNKNGEVCTLDDLNRLTSDSINNYGSDKNGYRTSKNEFNYSYDALGRLLSVSLNDDTITYSYDSFSRRLSRTTDQISVQYLYQFDTEIAALENNKIVEFKAIHGQFSPYAIELNDKVYTPIRNHRGDITVLLDSEKNAVSTNRYDAFGEFSHYGSIQSPWLFSSQRYDTLTKNYHFINREYDSCTGRWLTPDPLGFEDGLNLYAYVHNNPMIYVDPYGLWAEGVYNYGRGVEGVLQIAGGFTEASLGAVLGAGTAGTGFLIGGAMFVHGVDHISTGYHKVFNGRHKDTLTSQALQSTGLTPAVANFTDSLASVGSSLYAASRNILTAGSNLKLPTFRDPKNYCRMNFEEYKSSLRSQMEKPSVTDLKLKEQMEIIFRPGAKLGNGSTSAAIRHELLTLEKVGDKLHSQKGRNTITYLDKWLKNNPNATQGDRTAAEHMIKDLYNALGE